MATAPDPKAVHAAAHLVRETPTELVHGTLSALVQRYTVQPKQATDLSTELAELIDKHLRRGLSATDAAFVLATHLNAIATTLHRALPEEAGEPPIEACVPLAMQAFELLNARIPTPNARFLIFCQMLHSCLATSAVVAQRVAADRREEGQQ